MSRVNEVKKILRDRGVEMDVDDVLTILRDNPRFRVGLCRSQVSTSLAELYATDHDIVRTRRGLYRYREAAVPTVPPRPADLPGSSGPAQPNTAPAPPPSVPPGPEPASTHEAARGSEVVVIIDLDHVRTTVTSQLGITDIDDPTLIRHATNLARRHLDAGPQTIICPAAADTIAAVVDALALPTPIVLIAAEPIMAAAQQLAGQLDRTITPLTIPGRQPTALRATPTPTPPKLPATAATTARSDATIKTRATTARLDPLSEIDHDGFHRPLHGITKTAGEHDRRRQARRIGESYAARWWKVVNNETHDRLLAWADRKADLPDDLHLDLLLFAERNGLSDPDQDDQQLRCGFWTAVRERRPLLAADLSAAS